MLPNTPPIWFQTHRTVLGERVRDGANFSLSEQTVKHHLSHIFDKLGVYSRLELAFSLLITTSTPNRNSSLCTRSAWSTPALEIEGGADLTGWNPAWQVNSDAARELPGGRGCKVSRCAPVRVY